MPRAISFSSYGGPEVLALVEIPSPDPGPGQVRVAVRAAGVNPIDWKLRSGAMAAMIPLQLPSTPGIDLAGVIDDVGADAAGFAVGDEVLGRGASTYAEQALADPAALARKPAALSWEQAAALGVAVDTTYRILVPLGLEAGQTLLVDGAAGGVGAILVQVARARGVNVVGTASERNHERLRAFGATPITYGPGLAERVAAVAPGGVAAAADLAGKGSLDELVEIVGDRSKVVTIVDGAGAGRLGVRFTGGGAGESIQGSLDDALRLIQEGLLTVPVGAVFPLAEATAAHRAGEAGSSDGRIVLRVS
jgi:NADPH:quinone reductase-like Zn-dependent oxidoreductase